MEGLEEEIIQLWKEHTSPRDIANKLGIEMDEVIAIIIKEEGNAGRLLLS